MKRKRGNRRLGDTYIAHTPHGAWTDRQVQNAWRAQESHWEDTKRGKIKNGECFTLQVTTHQMPEARGKPCFQRLYYTATWGKRQSFICQLWKNINLLYEVIGDTSAFSDVETLDALQALILKKNNPSVSCADSSLYTREPWFSVNRKCKCHTVNKRRFNSGFHILMKLSEILSMGESHFVDEVYWADILIFIRQRRSRQSLIRLPKRDSHSVGSVIRTVGTDKRLLVFVRKRYLYRIRPAPLEGGGTRSVTEGVCDILKSNLTFSHTRTLSIACRDSSLAEISIILARLFALS